MVTFSIDPGPLADAFSSALRQLDTWRFADALRTRRLDAWPGDDATRAVIGNRLGWIDAIAFVTPALERLSLFGETVRRSGVTDVVLLGMGGSSLAPEVLRQTLGVAPGWPRFRMLDSTDPAEVRDALAPAATSLFVLASKSGTTIEPLSMAAEARRRLEAAGVDRWASRFVAVTDPGTPLERQARTDGYLDLFVNAPDIGGRFSALSFFGLVPAAAMGLEPAPLLRPAAAMAALCLEAPAAENPGLALGALLAAGARTGRDKLTLVLPPALASLGLWIEQLVAESTGKTGTGVLPVAGEPDDAPVGNDRVGVVLVASGTPAPLEGRLRDAGAPLARHDAHPAAIGAEFFRWEVATAVAGRLLEVNPFDEPNVGQAKQATSALLAVHARDGALPAPAPSATAGSAGFAFTRAAGTAATAPERFLPLAIAGDYVALLAYVPPSSAAWRDVVERFRVDAARATRCASTLGYGPRYLHSTGQFHKGGPGTGLFVVLAPDPVDDFAVPDTTYSFGVLERAQALGDFQSLDAAGRRAVLVTCPGDPVRAADALARLLPARGA
jgi:glucose-6-phosphate isomerase